MSFSRLGDRLKTTIKNFCRRMSAHHPDHEKIYQLLDNNTTSKYYIEYQRGFVNHLSHSLVALDRLRASADLAEEFVKWSEGEKLESAASHWNDRSRKRSDSDATFYELRERYQTLLNEEYGGSMEELIAGELPKLSRGLVSGALHGLIHIGYGYAAERSWFVCEGFAYLKFCYLPLEFSCEAPALETLGLGSKHILDVLKEIREDPELITFIEETRKSLGENSTFSPKATALMTKSDRFAKFVHNVQFPGTLNARDFSLDKVTDLANYMVDCAIIVYAIAERRNDFFLLHGVTGSWGLKNVLPLLKTKDDVLNASRNFFCSLFVAYLIQYYPVLDATLLEQNAGMSHSWEQLVKQAIEHKDHEREHVNKLVQVCRDMSRESANPDMESVYRLASHNCVSNPFAF